ncbi:hypothetical protein BH23CHL2_BH23CHL2_24850 [soil metagenome]
MPARAALEEQADLSTRLVGLPCTQVSLGIAETLIIDFGELEPGPDGQMTGAFVLAVDCPWRIDGHDLPAVGWEDEEEDIAHLSTVLIGGSVEEVEVRRPGFDLIVQFSSGHRLRVFPDCRAYYSDEMSGGVLPWQLVGRAALGALQEVESSGDSTV